MAINHANYLPSFKQDSKTTQTWTSGNSFTVTDAHIKTDSVLFIQHTSIPVGHWRWVVADGSCVFTSSDAESNATFKYMIF